MAHDVPKKDNIIALDPGIRTFCTGYDPSGKVLNGLKAISGAYIDYAALMTSSSRNGARKK